MGADLERLYEIFAVLEAQPGQGRSLAEYTGRSGLPARGVYFFREPGEQRRLRPEVPRIVRVGTHAVSSNARSTLWGRLRSHRGSRAGGGNHRASIFRRHVGAALLARDQAAIGDLRTWGADSIPRSERIGEAEHERRVSEYLGRMSVLWVEVPDEPGPESRRAYIERNAIALLSNHLCPVDPPSETWLGLHSPAAVICRSGLWNVKHVEEEYAPGFLEMLAGFVSGTAPC